MIAILYERFCNTKKNVFAFFDSWKNISDVINHIDNPCASRSPEKILYALGECGVCQSQLHILNVLPHSVLVSALPTSSTVDLLTTTGMENEKEEEKETPIYEKHNQTLHGDSKKKRYTLSY